MVGTGSHMHSKYFRIQYVDLHATLQLDVVTEFASVSANHLISWLVFYVILPVVIEFFFIS